jgi:hypothetical protein
MTKSHALLLVFSVKAMSRVAAIRNPDAFILIFDSVQVGLQIYQAGFRQSGRHGFIAKHNMIVLQVIKSA